MRKRPLLFFFLIAYAFSWILSIPAILSTWGILPPSALAVFFIIKSFGPYVAAYVVTRVIDGREGMLRMRRSVRQVRVDRRWYVLILIGIPAVMLVVSGVGLRRTAYFTRSSGGLRLGASKILEKNDLMVDGWAPNGGV